jgi:2-oxoisovalerate ferredoxin oxidoreductase beta subunit
MSVKSTKGMYERFVRSGKDTRSTHYCAGCGHGILHKLIAEALTDMGLADRTVVVSPIGCSVFGYYYFDCGNIGAAHGRAPCVATALARGLPAKASDPDPIVISYQGDGDLGSIGFNNCFQAASRGERIVTFFVNNATYGMTGGQMAPTTLLGMKTETSPLGRTVESDGYPLHVCEVVNQLAAPVYIERCSLADTKRIMQARKAVRKALEIQRDGKGYAFVEFLSPCPTNMGMGAVEQAAWVTDVLEKEYPLGLFRDKSAEAPSSSPRREKVDLGSYFSAFGKAPVEIDEEAPETTYKISGFGGQGILSLGVMVSEAALASGRRTTWFPSYGPEQRGGSAACSVVMSGKRIGSPTVDHPDVLVCLNQPSFDRYAPEVKAGGLVIYESIVEPPAGHREDLRLFRFPATDIAAAAGISKAANTAMLGALFALGGMPGLSEAEVLKSLESSFAKKPQLIPQNLEVFRAAVAWCQNEIPKTAGAAAESTGREAVLA